MTAELRLVQNERSCAPAPSICLCGVNRDSFTFSPFTKVTPGQVFLRVLRLSLSVSLQKCSKSRYCYEKDTRHLANCQTKQCSFRYREALGRKVLWFLFVSLNVNECSTSSRSNRCHSVHIAQVHIQIRSVLVCFNCN